MQGEAGSTYAAEACRANTRTVGCMQGRADGPAGDTCAVRCNASCAPPAAAPCPTFLSRSWKQSTRMRAWPCRRAFVLVAISGSSASWGPNTRTMAATTGLPCRGGRWQKHAPVMGTEHGRRGVAAPTQKVRGTVEGDAQARHTCSKGQPGKPGKPLRARISWQLRAADGGSGRRRDEARARSPPAAQPPAAGSGSPCGAAAG